MANGKQHEKRVTCKEAKKLLQEGKVVWVHWRPDGVLSQKDPDNDLAIVQEVK